jgi:hypothetical protein
VKTLISNDHYSQREDLTFVYLYAIFREPIFMKDRFNENNTLRNRGALSQQNKTKSQRQVAHR